MQDRRRGRSKEWQGAQFQTAAQLVSKLNKRPKYGNKPKIVDGRKFQSTLEATRYTDLRLELRAGNISELQLQVPFEIKINGILLGRYLADFVYIRAGRVICEDAKGKETALFKFKWKCIQAQYAGQYDFRRYPQDYDQIAYQALKAKARMAVDRNKKGRQKWKIEQNTLIARLAGGGCQVRAGKMTDKLWDHWYGGQESKAIP